MRVVLFTYPAGAKTALLKADAKTILEALRQRITPKVVILGAMLLDLDGAEQIQKTAWADENLSAHPCIYSVLF